MEVHRGLDDAPPRETEMLRRKKYRLALLSSVALVALITFGAFSIAFAQPQPPALGSYRDSGCSTSAATILGGTGDPAYVQFENYSTFPSGYIGTITGTVSTGLTLSGVTSTCFLVSNPSHGAYTAYILSSGSSTSIISSIFFTVAPYLVEFYQDYACTSPGTTFTEQQYTYDYIFVQGNGDVGLVIAGPSTTITNSLGGTSTVVTATCTGFMPTTSGTYIAYVVSANTDGGLGSTEASNTFTVSQAYTVSFYTDPACASSPATNFAGGVPVYILFASPVDPTSQDVQAGVITTGSYATYIFVTPASSSATSASTCATVTSLPSGTYTAFVGVATTLYPSGTSNSPTVTINTYSTAFFSVSSAVPDLAYGFIPLMAILLVVYILLGRRVHPNVKQ